MEAAATLPHDISSLRAEAASLGMFLYTPCETYDILLTRWWSYMLESEQFQTLLLPHLRPLSAFLANFQPPTIATFASKDSRIWLAAWLCPFADANSGAFLNYWCHPDMRGTPTHARCAYIIYTFSTQTFPVVLGVVRNEKLLRIHRRLGYNIVGQIPHLLGGDDAWIVYLTSELFQQSRFARTHAHLKE